jgi:hypothetical protein
VLGVAEIFGLGILVARKSLADPFAINLGSLLDTVGV